MLLPKVSGTHWSSRCDKNTITNVKPRKKANQTDNHPYVRVLKGQQGCCIIIFVPGCFVAVEVQQVNINSKVSSIAPPLSLDKGKTNRTWHMCQKQEKIHTILHLCTAERLVYGLSLRERVCVRSPVCLLIWSANEILLVFKLIFIFSLLFWHNVFFFRFNPPIHLSVNIYLGSQFLGTTTHGQLTGRNTWVVTHTHHRQHLHQ